jgi:hypothetical protein
VSIGKNVLKKRNTAGILTKKESEELEEMKKEIAAERAQKRVEEGRGKVRPVQELKGGAIPGELPPENVDYEIEEKTRTIRKKGKDK